MKKFLVFIAAALAICLAGHAQAQTKKAMESKKILVAYYSATGTTERVAKLIATATGGTLYKIQPAQTYTANDLDWNDKSSRSSREMADPQSRPAISANLKGAEGYDTIYLGYPIWWDEAPRVVNTFLETYRLEGKTIIPFATSGGSGIGNSVNQLKKSYPGLKWEAGKLLNNASRSEVEKWVRR